MNLHLLRYQLYSYSPDPNPGFQSMDKLIPDQLRVFCYSFAAWASAQFQPTSLCMAPNIQ